MSLEIRTKPWNHHHHQGQGQVHLLQCFFLLHYYCCYYVNVRSTLRHLRMHNMVAIGPMKKIISYYWNFVFFGHYLPSLLLPYPPGITILFWSYVFGYSDFVWKRDLTLSFWAWLFSLSIASSRFIHVVTNDRTSVFLKAGQSIASHFLLSPHPLADSWIVSVACHGE